MNAWFRITAASLLAVLPMAVSAAPDPVLLPIHQLIDGFNSGNVKAIISAHAASGAAIIDEGPPHVWSGPKAVTQWLSDLAVSDKAEGRSDGVVSFGKPTLERVDGDTAYVIGPTVYNFKQKGIQMHEPAQMTFALKKIAGSWKITGWTWVGTDPKPAK